MPNTKADGVRLRSAWRDLGLQIEPNLMLMLDPGTKTSSDGLSRDARSFFNHAQRQAYGPRWAKRPAAEFVRAVGFQEHRETNRHMHLAVAATEEMTRVLRLEGTGIWRSIRRGGAYFWDYIDVAERYLSYSTKEVWLPEHLNDAFVYGPK